MDILLSYVLPITSTLVAVVSIILSIMTYRREIPKIKIGIERPKYDCFFGVATREDNRGKLYESRISGVRFTIHNNSSVDIEVNDVFLIIGNERFRLISNDNPYWDLVCFFSYDHQANKVEFDGSYAINYREEGINLPVTVLGYTTHSSCALFYHFPANISGKVNAKLYVKTAIGVRKKKIVLLQYNNTFQNKELEDAEQYSRSVGESK